METIEIIYSFLFKDGSKKDFKINLDRETLGIVPREDHLCPPVWTRLERNRCSLCPIDERTHVYCPIARNLSGISKEFGDRYAHDAVTVTVLTEERTYSKETTIQEGLGGIIGIIMATSGCPVMEYLKPMARFHLPFASLTETIFRITSVYLISQLFVKKKGGEPDWNLDEIGQMYSQIGQLNRDFARRLSEAAKKDANVNALVNLDCFAAMVPMASEETLAEIKKYYTAYLK